MSAMPDAGGAAAEEGFKKVGKHASIGRGNVPKRPDPMCVVTPLPTVIG